MTAPPPLRSSEHAGALRREPVAPRGALQISSVVIDRLVTISAGRVAGVLSSEVTVGGALLGSALGGALGLAHGGPAGSVVGVAVGASLGTAAEAAAAHLRNRREHLPISAIDNVQVHVVVRFGENLYRLSDKVRASVRASLHRHLGTSPSGVHVIVTDVIGPAIVPVTEENSHL